jgi:hypothetical protein
MTHVEDHRGVELCLRVPTSEWTPSLSIEFGDLNVPKVAADAVVLAGDVHVGLAAAE